MGDFSEFSKFLGVNAETRKHIWWLYCMVITRNVHYRYLGDAFFAARSNLIDISWDRYGPTLM